MSIMQAMGANAVRLYGNDPNIGHATFLDEAQARGLHVYTGISDYPYTQMPGNCKQTGFDCYEQIKRQYTENLQRGFLMEDRSYHPALRMVNIMNEPDLKFTGGPSEYCKVLVSAFDAILDAEREARAWGQAPNFTVTFSFGVCPQCSQWGTKPALGQLVDFRRAVKDPASVGYTARNDLWYAYTKRFTNSVNTCNPYSDIRPMFLDDYDGAFQGTPVFLGEYHSPKFADLVRDLAGILELAADPLTLLMGISFFEFQTRYDKGGEEMSFGMFGLDSARPLADTTILSSKVTSYCLTPVMVAGTQALLGAAPSEPVDHEANAYVHTALTAAFRGPGTSLEQLCPMPAARTPSATSSSLVSLVR